jgi:hypothetical protein
LTVNGPVSLMLDDHLNTKATDYVITPTTVTDDTGFGGLTYSGLKSLDVIGAAANDTFTVNNTSTVTILDGTDANNVNFYVNSDSNPVAMYGGTQINSFFIGNGNLTLLPAQVTVFGRGTGDYIFIQDRTGSYPGNYLITAFSVTGPGFGGLMFSNCKIVAAVAAH